MTNAFERISSFEIPEAFLVLSITTITACSLVFCLHCFATWACLHYPNTLSLRPTTIMLGQGRLALHVCISTNFEAYRRLYSNQLDWLIEVCNHFKANGKDF